MSIYYNAYIFYWGIMSIRLYSCLGSKGKYLEHTALVSFVNRAGWDAVGDTAATTSKRVRGWLPARGIVVAVSSLHLPSQTSDGLVTPHTRTTP